MGESQLTISWNNYSGDDFGGNGRIHLFINNSGTERDTNTHSNQSVSSVATENDKGESNLCIKRGPNNPTSRK